jgi:hypothetical protein
MFQTLKKIRIFCLRALRARSKVHPSMVTTNEMSNRKRNKRRFLGLPAAARALGVDRTHLWRVLTGQRVSLSLRKRFRAFQQATARGDHHE